MKISISLSFLFALAVFSAILTASLASNLTVGFYRDTCPSAEDIVRNVVNRALSQDPGLGAGLIRMHFHDCFVRGCDASVLLDSTPGNLAEKEHGANNPSLRGYEVIDEAKAELETQCPETVSCADIIAFAARDSAFRLGRINYAVEAGRRDGTISNIRDPNGQVPLPSFNLTQLQQNFANKGLSLEELVVLSGAHSIGVSHCIQFSERLYSFNATHAQDPSLDPILADELRSLCPNPATNVTVDPTVSLDPVTPDRLDNLYYAHLQNNRGLFTSDHVLMSSPTTARMVRTFDRYGRVWARKFAEAMVHMGSIEVLTGTEGQIRWNCRAVNYW